DAARLARLSLGDARRVDDGLSQAGVVAWRHDVHARYARRLVQLLDQLVTDLAAFAHGIAGAFHPGHDRVGNDGAGEVLADPARRTGGPQGHKPDQKLEAAEAVFGQALRVAPGDAGIHAELRLGELGAGIDLGLEALRLPAGRWIDGRIRGADEEAR